MKPLLDAIKGFEGYAPKAAWDHKQYSIGYGTRAAGPNDTITPDEAERRLGEEVGKARALVERFAPNAPDGVKAALTSLTYNAGADWMSSGLGAEIKAGDYSGAKDNFLAYNKASGQYNQGLANRRAQEVAWFDSPMSLGGPTDAPQRPADAPLAMIDGIGRESPGPAPASPQMAGNAPSLGMLDFNDPQLGASVAGFGDSVGQYLQKMTPKPPQVQMAQARRPNVNFATVAQLLANRAKPGVRGQGGHGLT